MHTFLIYNIKMILKNEISFMLTIILSIMPDGKRFVKMFPKDERQKGLGKQQKI